MFVIDVFKGNPLILSFGWGAVLTNWILFVVFVGVPFLVCIASLLSGSERVLELTMVTSFLSVSIKHETVHDYQG
jgi:ABC-type lipoprotein release transport system permease subunit